MLSLFQVFGENNFDEIGNHIVAGNLVTAEKLLYDFELNNLNVSNDSLRSDFYYVKGILLEQQGDSAKAMESFVKSYELGKAIGYNSDQSHFDTMVRIMDWYYLNNEYDSCARIGMDAIKVSDDILAGHSATPYMFSMLVQSFSNIMKYAIVPQIVQKAYPFVQKLFSPTDEHYYELPLYEAYAYLCMLQPEKADSLLIGLKQTYISSGATLHNIEAGFERLGQNINTFGDWKQEAKENFKHLENIIFVDPTSPEGSKTWKLYFQWIRNNLEYLYLDPNDVEDEAFWNELLAWLRLNFYVFCNDMPGRSGESYNNVLLTKNFLEYHYKRIHKQPTTWESVVEMLNNNEAAIEISLLPNEFLIIKKGLKEPLSIPIDTLMCKNLLEADIHDAEILSELYRDGGILQKLWMKVDPALEGVETIYLSTSHVFARFNYSAIPLNSRMAVSDKYKVINVLSTADIEVAKKNQGPIAFNNAILYGGIEYDVSQDRMLAEAKSYTTPSQKHKWSLTRGLPANTRRNFEYLKGSLDEVISIDNTLSQNNVHTKVYTGASANEESIKCLEYDFVDLIHLSTHGLMLEPLFSSDKGKEIKQALGNRYQTILSQSGLFLAGSKAAWINNELVDGVEDGILTSKEIAELNLDGVKLVVLSACDTGLGNDSNLTGASFGVHYAFKIAGVEKLLVCLWQVDDEATSFFMKSFYQNLLYTRNYHDALTTAKKEMIAVGYDNPYYWAPFILIE